MAAKTFDSWLSDSGHASWPSSMCQAMNKAWNAATKAAEARFTSHNTGSPKFLSFDEFDTICISHGISTATARLVYSEVRQKLRAGA